jgi:hypothetical protein
MEAGFEFHDSAALPSEKILQLLLSRKLGGPQRRFGVLGEDKVVGAQGPVDEVLALSEYLRKCHVLLQPT